MGIWGLAFSNTLRVLHIHYPDHLYYYWKGPFHCVHTPVPQKKTMNVLKYETMTNLFLGKEYPVLI